MQRSQTIASVFMQHQTNIETPIAQDGIGSNQGGFVTVGDSTDYASNALCVEKQYSGYF